MTPTEIQNLPTPETDEMMKYCFGSDEQYIRLKDARLMEQKSLAMKMVAEELRSIIDDCKGHGTPIIRDRVAAYLALTAYTRTLKSIEEMNAK